MSEVETPLREVRFRVAACFALVMLSVDALNPIKFLCKVSGVDPMWVAYLSSLSFIGLLYANASDLIYFFVKVFFHSVLSIFFTSMEVLGKQNIPPHGPVIFTGNHMNQFVDAAMIVITSPHPVSFLVAEKSYHDRIIGDFAKAMRAIPVSRPQDKAEPGPGKIRFEGLRARGIDTKFTALGKGDKVRPGKSPDCYRFKEVISDTEAVLVEELGEPSPLHAVCQTESHPVVSHGGAHDNGSSSSNNNISQTGDFMSYDILGFVDQGQMFEAVQVALARGCCLGIFPEGGSHDHTDLLPLKVGVAAIALGVLEKHDVSVPIVPVGLTYFRGDRFRGRVVVEYGEPILITKDLMKLLKESRRAAYHQLLTQVEEGMRSVIVTATDYSELKLLHTVRRLYQRNSTRQSTTARQDLSRRFSTAHRLLRERYGGTLPPDMLELQARVQQYQDELDKWGLVDHQVQHLDVPYSRVVLTFIHGLLVFLLASLPSLVLNAPVGVAAKFWAETQAKKDLKKSRVKVQARDVVLSRKITFCLVAVPTMWILYAVLLWYFSPLDKEVVIALFICMPLFSYFGVTAVEAGMVKLKDIRPAGLRLLPGFKHAAKQLPLQRAALVKDVRAMARKYGPELGAVYSDKGSDWEKHLKRA